MNGKKKKIVKKVFSPVFRKFQRIQIQTHYKNECWSIDLIDRSSLAKYNKNLKFIFTIIDNHTKYAWAIPLEHKSGKSTTTAFEKLIKTSKRNRKKSGQIEVKSFIIKHFWFFWNKLKFKYIQPIQI